MAELRWRNAAITNGERSENLRLHNRRLSERLGSFLRRFTGTVCVVSAFEALRGHFCKHRTRRFSRLIGSSLKQVNCAQDEHT